MKMQNHKNEPWKHEPKTAETRAKMSAAARCNRNAAKPAELRRVQTTVALSREAFEKLEKLAKATGKSRGKVLDALILTA